MAAKLHGAAVRPCANATCPVAFATASPAGQ